MLRQNVGGFTGGVLSSTDFGATWKDVGHATGLQAGAATSVVLDPSSPVASRTLWASVLGCGVYKSTDGGSTWSARNSGLGMPNNLNTWILKRLPDGTLYVSVTLGVDAARKSYKGGLFRSEDGGDHWTLVNQTFDLNWIVGYNIDAQDPKRIYVGCFQAPQLCGRRRLRLPGQRVDMAAHPRQAGGLGNHSRPGGAQSPLGLRSGRRQLRGRRAVPQRGRWFILVKVAHVSVHRLRTATGPFRSVRFPCGQSNDFRRWRLEGHDPTTGPTSGGLYLEHPIWASAFFIPLAGKHLDVHLGIWRRLALP